MIYEGEKVQYVIVESQEIPLQGSSNQVSRKQCRIRIAMLSAVMIIATITITGIIITIIY